MRSIIEFRQPPSFDYGAFESIISGRHEDPASVLGPQRVDGPRTRLKVRANPHHTTKIRAFLPGAKEAWIVNDSGVAQQPMLPIGSTELFEADCATDLFEVDSGKYKIEYTDGNNKMSIHDPYAFEPLFSDLDLHLFNEGTHFRIYERLGAHLREIDGVKGVNFAVWAPNAEGLSVIGDFNGWDDRRHPMKKLIPSGVWENFCS